MLTESQVDRDVFARRGQCNGGVVLREPSRLTIDGAFKKQAENGNPDAKSERGRAGRGRRTDEELPGPTGSDGTDLDDRGEGLQLHQHNDSHSNRNRGGGMEHDAERTVIGIRIERMDMRDLNDG